MSKQELSEEQWNILTSVTDGVMILSTVSALTVALIVLTSRCLGFSSAQRLSFKISFWVAFSDLIYDFFYTFPRILELNGYDITKSDMSLFWNVLNINSPAFANMWYVTLVTLMAVNLYFTFVIRSTLAVYMTERNIVLVSLLPSLILFLPASFACYYLNVPSLLLLFPSGPYRLLMMWTQNNLFIFLCVIFNCIVITRVIRILFIYNKTVKSIGPDKQLELKDNAKIESGMQWGASTDRILTQSHDSESLNSLSQKKLTSERKITTKNLSDRLNFVAIRVAAYAVIPVLTQTYMIFTGTYYQLSPDRSDMILRMLYDNSNNINGFLNAVVFFFDPALPDIIDQFKARFFKKSPLEHFSSQFESEITKSELTL